MTNERYKLTADGMKWTVSDTETGFAITFVEGLFNETQEVKTPENLPNDASLATYAATAMRGIGDYISENHPDIASCDVGSRCTAIWTLPSEKYWIAMAAACNSLLIDFEEDQAEHLYMEVNDYLELDSSNPADLNEAEKTNLLGALSLLDDFEAEEVFTILLAYWHEHYENHTSIRKWASDLLWWPAFAKPALDKLEEEEDGEA